MTQITQIKLEMIFLGGVFVWLAHTEHLLASGLAGLGCLLLGALRRSEPAWRHSAEPL
jgi:hypothetical protein